MPRLPHNRLTPVLDQFYSLSQLLVQPSVDVNITWLLNVLNKDLLVDFKMDRGAKECHTPRRNPWVEEALRFMGYVAFLHLHSSLQLPVYQPPRRSIHQWANLGGQYFRSHLFPIDPRSKSNAVSTSRTIFVPVVPLFYATPKQVLTDGTSEYVQMTYPTKFCRA
jgi:hypothetical protein